MQIDVSLETYKGLTQRLERDGQSYDDVIRKLLALVSEVADAPCEPEADDEAGINWLNELDPENFHSRGLKLPAGTVLRAQYKGRTFSARIENGEWISETGEHHSSPSAAARAITGNNVNGLRFWEALLPGDRIWRRLETLVRQ